MFSRRYCVGVKMDIQREENSGGEMKIMCVPTTMTNTSTFSICIPQNARWKPGWRAETSSALSSNFLPSPLCRSVLGINGRHAISVTVEDMLTGSRQILGSWSVEGD